MIHRALLALIAWLLALLPPGTLASIPRTAFVPAPMALFGVEFSNEQDCEPLTLHLDGLHDRAGPCGGVLVRQNPWSAFDPEGLFEWSAVGRHLKNTAVGVFGYANALVGSAYEILSLGTNGTNSSQQFTNKTLGMVAGMGNWVINDAGQAMRGVASAGDIEQAFEQGMSAFGEKPEEQVANLITLAVTEGAGRFMKVKGGAGSPGGEVSAADVAADTAITVEKAPPKSLVPRQGPSEMTGSKVKKLTKDMKKNGFDPAHPIEVAEVDGKKIILDGHHRAEAAARAGIKEVPVEVKPVTSEQAEKLSHEAAEAAAERAARRQ